MTRRCAAQAAAIAVLCAAPARAGLLGFSTASAADEAASEKAFDASLDRARMRSWMERMSSEPNQVGSPHDRANADFMLAQFREWGWDAHIETFWVLYPTPRSEAVELLAPTRFKASLAEPPVRGDATSARQAGGLPPYNVYGADGDVTAGLVYVNFGMPEDYAELGRRGVGVRGRIVIARYGGGWRGLKVKLAQEHGAAGCLIYSDPHEDGYRVADTYPGGPARPAEGVQRGSVADMTLYTGDPLTPGIPSTRDAVRLRLDEAAVLPRIPVLPMSYADAGPLLAALGGAVAPPSWRGALPITYHIGPGPARVRLAVRSDWGQKPIYDVIATIRGSQYPDQWVLRGNHHDGWVFGAWDPLSGNVSEMGEARALGALLKAGWRPKRTIVYCGWDGEEPGLLGSTEWAEAHEDELRRKAVLYVNSDTNARGFLSAGGSHSFQRLVNEVAAGVTDPETGASVLERVRAALRVEAAAGAGAGDVDARAKLAAAEEGADLPLNALGGGSDYSPFLQHVGVPSVDLAYSGEAVDQGIYHSAYDSFDHFVRFGDPTFAYEAALAQTAGRIVMRTADAEVLPMRLGDLADAAARYAGDVRRVADREREQVRRTRRLVQDGSYRLASDPEAPVGAPEVPDDDVPVLDFSRLDAAASRLSRSAAAYDAELGKAAAAEFRAPAGALGGVNRLLQGIEQTLLSAPGLPRRPWYRHMLYAPGAYTGYGAKTMPAVREAIEQRRWAEAEAGIALVAGVLDGTALRIDEAAAALRGTGGT
ncbi:MAG TPA: transferrin receptor-like dimerization domain-containing protein [Opitutaceae bacterium]|jgi:N-acetylated-alpha-linked acidic dipeptidase